MLHAFGEDEGAVAFVEVWLRIGQLAAIPVGAVDELDAEAVDRGQHGIDAIGALDFVGQEGADFFVREMALLFGLGDEFLQREIITL